MIPAVLLIQKWTVLGNYIEAKLYCFTINEWLLFEVDMSGTEVIGLGE